MVSKRCTIEVNYRLGWLGMVYSTHLSCLENPMFSMVNSTDPFLGIFLVISGMVHYWVYDAMFVAIVQIHSETVTLNHAKTVPRKKMVLPTVMSKNRLATTITLICMGNKTWYPPLSQLWKQETWWHNCYWTQMLEQTINVLKSHPPVKYTLIFQKITFRTEIPGTDWIYGNHCNHPFIQQTIIQNKHHMAQFDFVQNAKVW